MSLTNSLPARQPYLQDVSWLHTTVTFADNGVEKTVGVLPAGAIIVKPISGLVVTTAFDAGTNNYIDIGTTANDDLYGTDLSAAATNFVPLDEAVSYKVTADTTVTVTVGLTGDAATAGEADVMIAFILP